MPGKILVVDDDAEMLEITRRLLLRGGNTVVVSSTPRLIATLLEREKPDLVLVDVNMPELSGEDLVAFVRSFGRIFQAPLIFYSGLEEEKLAELVQRTGATGYISKTAMRGKLLLEIERFLAPR